MVRADVYAKVSRRALGVAQHYASAYADAQRNSLVIVRRPYTYSAQDGTYGRYEDARTIYDDPESSGHGGPAGVTPTSEPMVVDFSSEPQAYSSITAYLPVDLDEDPMIDDLLEVIVSPESAIVGRTYRVTSVSAGGRLVSSTVLSCTGLAPTKEQPWR